MASTTHEKKTYWKCPLKKRPVNFLEKYIDMDEPQDLRIKLRQPLEKDLARSQSPQTRHELNGKSGRSEKTQASNPLTRVNMCNKTNSTASTSKSVSENYHISEGFRRNSRTPSVPDTTRPIATASKSHRIEDFALSEKSESISLKRPKTMCDINTSATLWPDITVDSTPLKKFKSNNLLTPLALSDSTRNNTILKGYHNNKPLMHAATSGINSGAHEGNVLHRPETTLFPTLVPKVALYPHYSYQGMPMPPTSPYPSHIMSSMHWPHYHINYDDNFTDQKIPRQMSKVEGMPSRESTVRELQLASSLPFHRDRNSRVPPNMPLYMMPIHPNYHNFDGRTNFPVFHHTQQGKISVKTDRLNQPPPCTIIKSPDLNSSGLMSPNSTVSDDSGLGIEASSDTDEDKATQDPLPRTQQPSKVLTEAGATATAASIHRANVYTCDQCPKSFSSNSVYTKHKVYHCKGNGETFTCKQCNKNYSSRGSLSIHMRTHSLPFKCLECKKAFSRPWLLQGHIRTHTGERPYKCTTCSKSFADKSNMRAHSRTHTGIKKYACPTCPKRFSRIGMLNKHLKSLADIEQMKE